MGNPDQGDGAVTPAASLAVERVMSRVSVIIPAYGRAWFVARAIASVRRQTLPCEIIVVDDGSDPPLSAQLPSAVLENIRLVVNPCNMNAAHSRNQGVAAATCPIVAFLDSDDEWLPDHLEHALETCRFDDMQVYVTPLTQGPAGRIPDAPTYLFSGVGDYRSSGLICTRRAFEAVDGFDAQLQKHQDWDFVLRAATLCPLYAGNRSTICLDLTAPGRMSDTSNLDASRRFFDRHRIFMSRAHQAMFWDHIIKFCVATGDLNTLRRTKALARHYISLSDLDPLGRLCWVLPRASHHLFRLRRALKARTVPIEAI